MGATKEFAQFVEGLQFEDIPAEAVQKSKEMILDTIGVILSGALEPSGKIVVENARQMGSTPEATVLVSGSRISAMMGAFTNGVLARTQDFSDWLPTGEEKDNWPKNAGHISCVLVPAVLAVGEKLGLGGKDILAAYLIGFEVFTKIVTSCRPSPLTDWHNMGIFGGIGATASCGRLFGLSVDQIATAFGLAASAAGGLYFNTKSLAYVYDAGRSARNGVEASLLAKQGFTANQSIIELPMGLCDSFMGEGSCDYARMTRNLGNPFHIVYPGAGIKPYPCAWPTFSALEGIIGLMKENNIGYDDVQVAEVWVSPFQEKRWNIAPTSGFQARMGLPFVCASALLDGKITRDSFKDSRLQDPRVKEAMTKVKLVVDETRGNEVGLTHASIVLKLKGGQEYRKLVLVPRGHPKNPLTHDEVVEKYRENAEAVLPRRKVDRSIQLIDNLERVENIQELISTLVS